MRPLSEDVSQLRNLMLISRYLFRQTFSALLTILIALTLIVWLTSILREVKLLTSQGQTLILFLKITSLAIPNLLVTVAPVAFLIACLHTLNRLSGDSELIVLSAAGASVWRLFTPYFTLSLLVSVFVLLSNLYLLPAATRLLGDYVSQIRSDIISQVLQPGEFSDLERGLTVHIRDKGPDGDLLGVVVHDERDKKMTTTVIADHGQLVTDGQRSVMELKDGQILREREGNKDVQIVTFQSYIFDMGDFTPKQGAREKKPRERDIAELVWPEESSPYYQRNKAKLRSELHERLSTPLYAPFFAVLALVYLGRPRTTREGRMSMMFTAFLLGAVIRGLGIAGVNIVGKQSWALLLLYGLPVCGFFVGLLMLRYNIGAPSIVLPAIRLPRFSRPSSGSAPPSARTA